MFDWDKLELSEISKRTWVEIWDLSNLLHPFWTKKLTDQKIAQKELLVFTSYKSLFLFFRNFLKTNKSSNVCIYNSIPNTNFFEFFINFYFSWQIKKTNYKVITFIAPGLPDIQAEHVSLIKTKRIIKAISKVLTLRYGARNFVLEVQTLFVLFLTRIFPKYLTHILVAGDYYLKLVKSQIHNSSNITIVEANTSDYSEYIYKSRKSLSKSSYLGNYVVFLDSPDPYFAGDNELSALKPVVTKEIWYPSLCNFFKNLELQLSMPVIICGHPKTELDSMRQLFEGRHVIYGKTNEMIKNSNIVITRNSMAISFAVLYKKPIIHVVSNQMYESTRGISVINEIHNLASELESSFININNDFIDLNSSLAIDMRRYSQFCHNYLTGANNTMTNYEIIFNKVMHIRN